LILFEKGLKGESAVSCHQTLAALAACLPALLLSHESKLALPLLHALPTHKLNPYWLVKVQHLFLKHNSCYIENPNSPISLLKN
jgi:hypothetical protein